MLVHEFNVSHFEVKYKRMECENNRIDFEAGGRAIDKTLSKLRVLVEGGDFYFKRFWTACIHSGIFIYVDTHFF